MAKPDKDVREGIVTSRNAHRSAPSRTAPGDDATPGKTSARRNCLGGRVQAVWILAVGAQVGVILVGAEHAAAHIRCFNAGSLRALPRKSAGKVALLELPFERLFLQRQFCDVSENDLALVLALHAYWARLVRLVAPAPAGITLEDTAAKLTSELRKNKNSKRAETQCVRVCSRLQAVWLPRDQGASSRSSSTWISTHC